MHFAYPPRKSSHPHPYTSRQSRSTWFRRPIRLQSLAVAAVGAIFLLWLVIHVLSGGSGSSSRRTYIPPGTPKAVVVTVFEEADKEAWRDGIMENRRDYASRHGYTTFFANATDYYVGTATTPKTWAVLPAIRHAMKLFPHTPYIFYVAPSALIMAPQLSLEEHVVSPKRLESLMLLDHPVVPPDSVIHTFSHLRGENIDFIVAQDATGLSPASMIIRNGEWARYFIDAWFDPLYRSYNFQKAERHALEHLVQWHGTVLARMAIIPHRVLNAYVESPDTPTPVGDRDKHAYHEGDFIANFDGCHIRPLEGEKEREKVGKAGLKPKLIRTRNTCETEQAALLTRWKEMVDREGRH